MSTDTIEGRYEMVSSENYGEFLKAIGLGLIQRNLAEKAKLNIEITADNGRWTIRRLTALNNTEINFALGETFDEYTADGRKVESVVTIDSTRLTHKQTSGNDEAVTVSEFYPNEMKETYTSKGVTATRVFNRL